MSLYQRYSKRVVFIIFVCFFVYLTYSYTVKLIILYHVYILYVTLSLLFCLKNNNNNVYVTFLYIYLNVFWCIYFLYTVSFVVVFYSVVFENYYILVCMLLCRLNFVFIDLKCCIFDIYFYAFGFLNFLTKPVLFFEKFKLVFTQFNDRRKYILKKYVYTINHKRIAINYFFFSFWTALSGAALATMIRMELAYPGSPFFKGDSTRYLQTITAHGLIMVFFVVVPILFGGFANFLIPYHVGSKDVAYPRLNSIGF